MSRIFSLDLECVATGRGHNDRAPCWVALVGLDGTVHVDKVVKCSNIFSPLTAITGLTKAQVLAGEDFEAVRNEVVKHLGGPDAVIVGQTVKGDIDWMKLEAGKHYGKFIDIADSFKTYNAKYGDYSHYSLAQEAWALLNYKMHGANSHSPVVDCQIQLKLYTQFCLDSSKLSAARAKLQSLARLEGFPDFTKGSLRPVIDGVCHFKYNPRKCFCGQKTAGN
jgi:DNA polymerase III epsilon subunit-like protein